MRSRPIRRRRGWIREGPAGAAAAARRRELDIGQRSLAANGMIDAGALIAFEKGRSWPRERTRAKLEEVLRWPPGTIARLRQGEPVERSDRRMSVGRATSVADRPAADRGEHFGSAIESLPSSQGYRLHAAHAPIVSDLRQLEAVAARATRISRVTPALIKALSTVRSRLRRTHDARHDGAATLGQRSYAARRVRQFHDPRNRPRPQAFPGNHAGRSRGGSARRCGSRDRSVDQADRLTSIKPVSTALCCDRRASGSAQPKRRSDVDEAAPRRR